MNDESHCERQVVYIKSRIIRDLSHRIQRSGGRNFNEIFDERERKRNLLTRIYFDALIPECFRSVLPTV